MISTSLCYKSAQLRDQGYSLGSFLQVTRRPLSPTDSALGPATAATAGAATAAGTTGISSGGSWSHNVTHCTNVVSNLCYDFSGCGCNKPTQFAAVLCCCRSSGTISSVSTRNAMACSTSGRTVWTVSKASCAVACIHTSGICDVSSDSSKYCCHTHLSSKHVGHQQRQPQTLLSSLESDNGSNWTATFFVTADLVSPVTLTAWTVQLLAAGFGLFIRFDSLGSTFLCNQPSRAIVTHLRPVGPCPGPLGIGPKSSGPQDHGPPGVGPLKSQTGRLSTPWQMRLMRRLPVLEESKSRPMLRQPLAIVDTLCIS